MQLTIIIAAVVLPVAVLLLLYGVFRCCCSKSGRKATETTKIANSEGVTNLHLSYENKYRNAASIHDLDNKRKSNFFVLQRELSAKPFFNWADHPSLVSEAVEHGWSRFAFNGYNISSPSTRSKLLSLCVSGDQVRENGADISWDICLGSAEFMQKVRLNSGLKKSVLIDATPPLGVSCVTQTALPLPGPFLGNSSFPEEAYFEITVVSSRESESRKLERIKSEGEKTKLIQDGVNVIATSDDVRISVKEDDRIEPVPVSVGFSVGGSHPRRLPGSYNGSIGFSSDGSIYLDGIKLVSETKDTEWGYPDRVIGCGFDPSQKQVFFTLDSELVHIIQCKSEDFSRPLYPTLAANIDITVLVNLGQSPFRYATANVHRTPNPCFIGTNDHTAALGYDDSKELFSFSMGRFDAEFLNRSTTRSNGSVNSRVDIDEESEADLFEIVLERMNRSPTTPS